MTISFQNFGREQILWKSPESILFIHKLLLTMSQICADEIEPLRRNQKSVETPEISTFQRLMPQVKKLFSFFFVFFFFDIEFAFLSRHCCHYALHCHFSTLA